jgi:hypothetical protein
MPVSQPSSRAYGWWRSPTNPVVEGRGRVVVRCVSGHRRPRPLVALPTAAAAAMAKNRRLKITYLDHLDYDAIDEQFRRSDIVAVLSQWPEPLTPSPSKRCLPAPLLVAPSDGGLNDTLVHDHNGLHADPGDVDSWAHALNHTAPASRRSPPARPPSPPATSPASPSAITSTISTISSQRYVARRGVGPSGAEGPR